MVRRAQQHGLVVQRIDVLEQTDDDALQFAELVLVVAQFRERIKLVEEQHARPVSSVVEEHAQVLRGAAEE